MAKSATLPPLTQFEREQIIRGFATQEKFTACLKIRNKDGLPVQYKMGAGAKRLDAAIKKQEMMGQPVRICWLKASQVWASSSTSTQLFRRIPFFPGRRALIVADSDAHTKLVREYYEQYIKSYQDTPFGAEWQSDILLPSITVDNDDQIEFSNSSVLMFGTAANVNIGRSAPYNWAHLSEYAFYRDAGMLMTGLMQRIPNSPDSGVVVESTANGMGGDFYDLCMRAQDRSKNTGWEFVFLPWQEHSEYVMRPEQLGLSMDQFQRSLTRSEMQERDTYSLNMFQLVWRRWCIESNCEGKVGRFQQEFPANPQEAFQSSGRTVFDMQALSRQPLIPEPSRGWIERVQTPTGDRIQFGQRGDGRGELAVYRQPIKGHDYVVGADHAEGIDPAARGGAGMSDPDYSGAAVYDRATGEQVAVLRVRCEPQPWAEQLYLLIWWYNWAYICPEAKAVGKAVIGELLRLGLPTELIYRRQRTPDDRRPALLQDLGYETNTVTKPQLISALEAALRDGSIAMHDPQSIAECQAFVRLPDGKMGAGHGHDDLVIANALAVIALRTAPVKRLLSPEEKRQAWKPVKYGTGRADDDED